MATGLRIGTRGSALALAQAELVRELLLERSPDLTTQIVVIRVSGDRGVATGQDDKSRWVDAIEEALLAGEIDLAVHSAKDVPAALADCLALIGAPARAPAQDVLCLAAVQPSEDDEGSDRRGAGEPLARLGEGARVGTSSIRRGAQLRAVRGDLEVVPLTGNVDTRLTRLERGELDAIVLARAGLQRLGREDALAERSVALDPARFIPAPGQGALALQARANDARIEELLAAITAVDATACLLAERALASSLGATCRTPLGAHAAPAGCGCLQLRGWVGLPDGSAWVTDELVGGFYDPAALGRRMAERMSAAGASELLEQAEAMAGSGV